MEHRKRVKMVLEYSNKYQTEVKGYDDIYGKGKSAEAVGAVDASAKYLSCMGLFLLEPWNPDGYKNGDTRSWIFWKNRIFRCCGDGRKSSCQPWICRNIWLHSNLFCGSGSMDRSMLLQCSDLPVVREEVNCKTETD